MLQISKGIFKKNDKYLLFQRSKEEVFPLLWDFIGGKQNPGETSEETIIREIREESDLIINPGPLTEQKAYQDGIWDIVFSYYQPTIISGTITLSAEHNKYDWFSKVQMKQLDLHPAVKVYFNFK